MSILQKVVQVNSEEIRGTGIIIIIIFYNNDLQVETKNKQKTYNSAPTSMLCDVGGELNVKNTKYNIKIY